MSRHCKLGLIFLAVAAPISIVTISLFAVFQFRDNAKPLVFKQPNFTFTSEANRTYHVLVGVLGNHPPSPKFEAIKLALQWVDWNRKPELQLRRDQGELQLGFVDREHGPLEAVSIASFTPNEAGPVHVNVEGWSGPNCVYLIDYGLSAFVLQLVALLLFNFLVAALVVRRIDRRRSTQTPPRISAVS